MSTKSICPLMSGTPTIIEDNVLGDRKLHDGIVYCKENKCQLWITVYSTENIAQHGCSLELQPQMVNGLLRV